MYFEGGDDTVSFGKFFWPGEDVGDLDEWFAFSDGDHGAKGDGFFAFVELDGEGYFDPVIRFDFIGGGYIYLDGFSVFWWDGEGVGYDAGVPVVLWVSGGCGDSEGLGFVGVVVDVEVEGGGGDIASQLETLKQNAESRADAAMDNEKFKSGNYLAPPTVYYFDAIRGMGGSRGLHGIPFLTGRLRGWKPNSYV